jgi:hypothetical protein
MMPEDLVFGLVAMLVPLLGCVGMSWLVVRWKEKQIDGSYDGAGRRKNAP